MDYFKKRIREPSTWAGFAAMLELMKVLVPQYAGLIVGLQTVFGGVAVVANEVKG